MIKPKEFCDALNEKGIEFFTGVPDSLLKDFNAYVMDNAGENHIITANEGGAVALASGYHLATGKIPLVYMQNSGIGNAVNPLVSLADKKVYSIPMLLLVGWRGEPMIKDEPQHMKMGRINPALLKALEIPYAILDSEADYKKIIKKAVEHSKKKKEPYAILVKKDSFEKYKLQNKREVNYPSKREGALKIIADSLSEKDIIVSTTGKLSRELYEHREELKQKHGKDFLCVGNMGHSSMIALGIALAKPDRNVYCFDGDGAALMHLGGMAIIGQKQPKNFKHIIFNNGCHESVGGQPTAGFDVDFLKIALGCGYKKVGRAKNPEEIKNKIAKLKSLEGPTLLEIRISPGARENLGRPKTSPRENKEEFMENLKV